MSAKRVLLGNMVQMVPLVVPVSLESLRTLLVVRCVQGVHLVPTAAAEPTYALTASPANLRVVLSHPAVARVVMALILLV